MGQKGAPNWPQMGPGEGWEGSLSRRESLQNGAKPWKLKALGAGRKVHVCRYNNIGNKLDPPPAPNRDPKLTPTGSPAGPQMSPKWDPEMGPESGPELVPLSGPLPAPFWVPIRVTFSAPFWIHFRIVLYGGEGEGMILH